MLTDRQNTELATFVDRVLAEQQDPRAAAVLLYERGVTFSLICRVLAESGRRRAVAPPKSEEESTYHGLLARLAQRRAG